MNPCSVLLSLWFVCSGNVMRYWIPLARKLINWVTSESSTYTLDENRFRLHWKHVMLFETLWEFTFSLETFTQFQYLFEFTSVFHNSRRDFSFRQPSMGHLTACAVLHRCCDLHLSIKRVALIIALLRQPGTWSETPRLPIKDPGWLAIVMLDQWKLYLNPCINFMTCFHWMVHDLFTQMQWILLYVSLLELKWLVLSILVRKYSW